MMFEVSQNDFGYYITDKLENNDGTAFNLTGYTVKFVAWHSGSPSSPTINAPAVIDADPTTGKVSYFVKSTDFPLPDFLCQEWQALIGSTVVQSFPAGGNTIKVAESG